MAELQTIVEKVRSKNAGPFWLTIDIFCGSQSAYQKAVHLIENQRVAEVLGVEVQSLKRFDIEALNVIKISLPRPTVQGAINDRDMHGASWAVLIAEMQV